MILNTWILVLDIFFATDIDIYTVNPSQDTTKCKLEQFSGLMAI